MPSTSTEASPGAGTLFVVATPIGNLSDITARAVETLKIVDHVCAEDTRRTRILLSHSGVHNKPVTTLNAHASERAIEKVVVMLERGANVALVTDAGTPCISDPGSDLVRACHVAKIRVVGIPGVSAVITAASVSGLVRGGFAFLGFPPRRGSKRARFFDRVEASSEPTIFFEAPSRMQETLSELAALLPEREACIARELTKLHEEILVGRLADLATTDTAWRGELTLVIAGRAKEVEEPEGASNFDPALLTEIETALRAGARSKALAAELSKRLSRPKQELYSLVVSVHERLALNDSDTDSL
jgi:16S rRNA (cytidine1402-2'-O)-methyltransferase